MAFQSGPAVLIGPGKNKMSVSTVENPCDSNSPGPVYTLGHAGATMSRDFSCHSLGLGVLAGGLVMESLIYGQSLKGGKHAGNFTGENRPK